jgi:hypothetical protein
MISSLSGIFLIYREDYSISSGIDGPSSWLGSQSGAAAVLCGRDRAAIS